MNPPLRTLEDVEAIKGGLRDGTIDVIATDPAVHPKLQALFAGPAGIKLDAWLESLGIGPHFASGNGGDAVCAVLGVIVVLIAGSIWRRRKLQQVEHAAPSAG